MKAPGTAALAAAIFIFAIPPVGFGQTVEPIQTRLVRSIIGRSVENYDGYKLGTVKDFVFDMGSSQADYVLISSGGILGVGSLWKPVPPQAVSLATAKRGIVAVGGRGFRWDKAPTISRRRDLALLTEPTRIRAIYEFYGRRPSATGSAQTKSEAGIQAAANVTTKGRSRSDTAGIAGSPQLATDLIGSTVVNRQQEKVGRVSDLLVDLSGQKPAYAIISGKLSSTERSFAVRLALLTVPAGRKVLIDASRQQFEQAQIFDQKIWQTASINGSGIYAFPEGEMERSGRNGQGRKPQAQNK